MNVAKSSWLTILIFILVSTSIAQTPATSEVGANPYKSYSGGSIDHIQMQNGSLYLSIPLLSYKQLGKLSLSFSILANGSQWQQVAYCDGTGACTYTYTNPDPGPCATISNTHGSLTYSEPYAGGSAQIIVDQDLSFDSCEPEAVIGPTTYIWQVYDIIDSSRAAHTLGFNNADWSQMQANDGSGYMAIMPCVTSAESAITEVLPANCTPTIYEDSGVKHIFSTIPQYATYPAVTLQDPIGNQIIRSSYVGSSSTPTGVIIDSIQRHIPDPELLPMSSDISHCPNLQVSGQPALQSQTWSVPGYNTPFYLCYTTVNIATNFFSGGPGAQSTSCYTDTDGNYICTTWEDVVGSQQDLQSVVLPNGTYWGFEYNSAASQGQESYGDMVKVILPSGGSLNYTYETIPVCSAGDQGYGRAVESRTALPLTGNPVSRTYQYISPTSSGNANGPTFTLETDAAGNDTVHNFTFDYPGGMQTCGAEETSTKWFQGTSNLNTGGTVLKEEDTTYTYQLNPQDTYATSSPAHINVLPQTKATYWNGQLRNSITYGYDTLFTSVEPYSAISYGPSTTYGVMSQTAPISLETPTAVADNIATTVTTRYAGANPTYQAAGLLSLPGVVSTYDPTGNLIQQTTYVYDEPNCSPQGAYGNLTSMTRDYGIKTSTCYNSFAMETSSTDARGYTTRFNYDSTGIGISSIQWPTTNGVAHIRYYQQDPNTDWTTAISDENASSSTDSAHTTHYSYDLLGRLTQVNYPDGGQVTQCYTDEGGSLCGLGSAPFSVITQRKQSASINLNNSSGEFDGLGRPIRTVDTAGAFVDTTYDSNGNVASVSNPYYSSNGVNGIQSYLYDPLARKTFQCQQDNLPLNATTCSPNNSYESWSYSGNTAVYTDENGHVWSRSTDGHNRLTQIVEPGALTTNYAYDPLDNLISADQLGNGSSDMPRNRTFTYDALSRLSCASNPENSTAVCPSTYTGSYTPGTIGYSYDSNGNLITKTDNRGVTTTYYYDSLNRITNEQSSGVSGVPGVNYTYGYDSVSPPEANGIGRLLWTTNGTGEAEQYFYDAVGRVTSQALYLPSAPSTPQWTSAVYDLAGNITDLTYPDGRHIKQTWDSASHLTNSNLVDINGTPTSQTYLSSVLYNPDGTASTISLGNNVQQTIVENNRLQPQSIRVASTQPQYSANSFASHTYCYVNCTSGGVANNGNIWQIADTLNSTRNQDFTYDALNRITSYSLGGMQQQQFHLDSFGNMSLTASNGTPLYSFDATNKISNLPCASSATPYDAAGNQTCDTDPNGAVRIYGYDAANAMTSITISGSSQPFETYVYSANGNRVRKTNADGTFTEYVDFGGQPIAEKNPDGTWSDYIYANGRRVARSDNYDIRIHLSGTNCSNCGNPNLFAGTTSLTAANGYTVRTGDILIWRQYQSGSTVGGLFLGFLDSNNNYVSGNTLTDSDSQLVDQDTTMNTWHVRTVNLSSFAGYKVDVIDPFQWTSAPAGSWDIYYGDITLVSTDGSVIPVYNRSMMTLSTATNPGVSNFQAVTEKVPDTTPLTTVTYYHDDQLGSARILTAGTGWPVASYTFSPFGQGPQASTNHYLFTGKERDQESGLDYFGARYYASSMGRFMSPDDPVDQHPADPQSWNLYSYVRNNPLILNDPTGEYACGEYVSADQCTAFGHMLTEAQSVLDKAKVAGTIDSDQYKAAEKALGAYGTLNDGNGVTVNVGATGGFPGNTIAEGGGEKTAANPTGQNIQVTLNGKLFDQGSSPALLGAIGHEGSHVEDAEAWAKAGFTVAANPSNFKTEFAAYGVTITIAQAQGSTSLSGTKPGGHTSMMFWNNSKSWMENQSMRGNMIRNFYPAWKVKAFGENTKGSGWGTK